MTSTRVLDGLLERMCPAWRAEQVQLDVDGDVHDTAAGRAAT